MSKKIVNAIITVLILIMITIPSYAENKTGSSSNKDQAKTSANTTNNTKTSNNTNTSNKSNVSNKASSSTEQNKTGSNSATQSKTTSASSGSDGLSNLGITPHDFSGFSESKTEYQVTVPSNITEVEIYATPKDSKASVTGTGKVKLQDGDNVEKIVVTSTKGTSKTYTITIKKLKVGEKENATLKKSELALESLDVSGLNLEPNFSKDIYQYTVNYDGSDKKLNITTKANKPNAKINIIGNEQLINGKNVVTIILTDEKETEVSTYQIYINKNIVEAQELEKSFNDANIFTKIKIWATRILVVLIGIFVILLIVILHRRFKNPERKKAKAKKKLNKIIWKNGQNKPKGEHNTDNYEEEYTINHIINPKDKSEKDYKHDLDKKDKDKSDKAYKYDFDKKYKNESDKDYNSDFEKDYKKDLEKDYERDFDKDYKHDLDKGNKNNQEDNFENIYGNNNIEKQERRPSYRSASNRFYLYTSKKSELCSRKH